MPGKMLKAWLVVMSGLALQASVLIAQQSPRLAASPWKKPPEKFRLATDMDCLYQQDGASFMTIVELFVPGGKSAVPSGKDGLAYLTTRITLEIPDSTVAQDIMAQATRLRLSALEDCSVISLECLSENLEESLRVASSIIQEPLFSGLRIDNIKRGMSLYAKADEDDAVATGHDVAMGAFFKGQGYGSFTYGTEASLKAIEKKDVTSFYGQHFTRNGIFFSVCTNLEKEKVRPLLEKYFAKFPSARTESPSATAPSLPDGRDVSLGKETKQSYVARAFLLPPATQADLAKGYLLEVLLGVGPGSRLWDLRAAGKLAYNISARLTWMRGCGVIEAYLETENVNKARAVAALDGILGTLHASGVTDDEFRMTKSLARAQMLRSLETKKARAQAMGLWELLGLGFDYLSTVFDSIDAVTAADMNTYIKNVLDPQKSILVVIGGKGSS